MSTNVNTNNPETNTDTTSEYALLKLLIEQLQQQQAQDNNASNKSISTVTTLWIVLFGLIILQKVFKYIAKPMYRHYSATNTRHNSEDDDSKSI